MNCCRRCSIALAMCPMRADHRRGFTLVEVIVALVVSAVAVLGARLLLERLADGTSLIVREATADDARANGERMLRDLALRLEIGTIDAGPFVGGSDSARFTSWCDAPRGWRERCTVSLRVRTGDARDTVIVSTSTGLVFPALDAPSPIELRYLNDVRASGIWFSSWGAGITAPLAIGIAGARDTIILRVGERG